MLSRYSLASGFFTKLCLTTTLVGSLLVLGAAAGVSSEAQKIEVVSNTELEFQPLNPARGDASPRAGMLWGDIRKNLTSGVLLKFAKGFSSPPHIHNITYRAVVISGALFNGDPNAEKMWMGPGSFWTQPAGETHITAASSDEGAMAFLEITTGPYLVQPSNQAFDNGERPINMEARNVVWLDASDVKWIETDAPTASDKRPEIAFLWGDPDRTGMNGTFLKLPAGEAFQLQDNGAWLRSVLIEGNVLHSVANESNSKNLAAGSYFGSKGSVTHRLLCEVETGCLIYVRTKGRYKVTK